MYGKSFHRNWNQSFSNTQIVEHPEMLTMLEEMNSCKMIAPAPLVNAQPDLKRPAPIVAKPRVNIVSPTNKQIEVRLADGKRRITPMFLTSAAADINKLVVLLIN